MQPPWLLLRLLLGSLLFFFGADVSEGVTIISPEQTTVTKAQGDKVTLPCKFILSPQDEGHLDIEWVLLQPNKENQVILYDAGKVYDNYHAAGRVQFVNPNPSSGDGSIDIRDLMPTDSGMYQCKVKKPPGVESLRITVSVLVKPMKTKCYVEGAEEIGNDVVLKCKSEEGSPVISYYWKKLDATEQLPATSVPNADTGDLLVKNASQVFSGMYKCVASNRVGSDECSLVLNVTPPKNRAGIIAGTVIGIFLGLLLIALLVLCCFKKQREKKYEKEVHHDIREDVLPPKSRASTAHSYIGSNHSSLGSMSPSNMDDYAKAQYSKVPSEDFERSAAESSNFPKVAAAPNLSRMGAIPVMIPAQSKDGSIV